MTPQQESHLAREMMRARIREGWRGAAGEIGENERRHSRENPTPLQDDIASAIVNGAHTSVEIAQALDITADTVRHTTRIMERKGRIRVQRPRNRGRGFNWYEIA